MKRYVRITVITALIILMAVLLVSCGGEGVTSGTTARSLATSSVAPVLDVAILNAGRYYIQVHTAINLGGEVRGQVIVPPGAAGVVTIVVALSGANVVPPVATNGTGTGTLVVNLATGTVVSASVVVIGLSSVVTAAHIHQGAAGVNGPMIVPITNITVF